MTKEQASIIIGNIPINSDTMDDCYSITEYQEAKTMAIKALEQESILDKIRAEITNIHLTDTDGHNQYWYRDPQEIINDALQIIDRYKAESDER